MKDFFEWLVSIFFVLCGFLGIVLAAALAFAWFFKAVTVIAPYIRPLFPTFGG